MARIAIMSVMISAAWFCAAQYVRYRNTLDDYGYKSILAKSMVAFLDQFKAAERKRTLFDKPFCGKFIRTLYVKSTTLIRQPRGFSGCSETETKKKASDLKLRLKARGNNE